MQAKSGALVRVVAFAAFPPRRLGRLAGVVTRAGARLRQLDIDRRRIGEQIIGCNSKGLGNVGN